MKKIVVLTGAGISAESGLKTFRDSNGLWEGYRVEDVATPEGWLRDPDLVLRFYNDRRRAAAAAMPNPGHRALAALEQKFDVVVVTQNVDDLHERAGSTHVIHLHGELSKARSSKHPHLIYDLGGRDIRLGDYCEEGAQLRPHIVWFGEAVPQMEVAIEEARRAAIFIVVGTSLVVYPAAALIDFVPAAAAVYIIDPRIPALPPRSNLHPIEKPASAGVPLLADLLLR